MNDIKLNEKQQIAYDAIMEGRSVFLTGNGGTGKSLVVDKVRQTKKDVVVACPTGVSAMNVGGATAHSIFGLPLGLPEAKDWEKVGQGMKVLFSGSEDITLIIDEIGYFTAMTLDLIDSKLQLCRGSGKPFGGIQVVVVGDFLQLEPIVQGREKKHYFEEYDTPFAFGAKCWSHFEPMLLTKVERNGDQRQVKMLNAIREGNELAPKAFEFITKEAGQYRNQENTLHLCSYKEDSAMYNMYWYNKIKDGEERIFRGKVFGNVKEKDMPVPQELKLREGCRVIIKANDIENGTYVNGDRGTVAGFSDEGVMVELEDNKGLVHVTSFTWTKHKYSRGIKGIEKKPDGEYKQIPILLGYAITVHSVQGITLDGAAIDMGRNGAFACGLFYVSLSRVRDLRNISFARQPSVTDIKAHEDAVKFYKELEVKSVA